MTYIQLGFYLKSGVDFDTENIIVDPGHIPGVTGFHMTPSGRGFLGIVAGGDWQFPVCFILYTDRDGDAAMYIPRAGNVVCWEELRAFNDDDEQDGVDIPEFNGTALLADICTFLDMEAQP